jgi:hypothetical protein
MEHESVSVVFEQVLRESYGPEGEKWWREGEKWWRFYPDGVLGFQAGPKGGIFEVTCGLGEIRHDADLDQVYADIRQRNEKLPADSLAQLLERDNYFWAESRVALDGLSPETIKRMIDACITLANSDAARALSAIYHVW